MQVDFSITHSFCTFARMKLFELTAEDYAAIYPRFCTVFDTPAFALLNAGKTTTVKFLSFTDNNNKPKFGLIIGSDGSSAIAPFSAPFSAIALPAGTKEPYTATIAEGLALLHTLYANIRITPPPGIYGSLADKLTCALFASGYKADYCNVNHYYSLDLFSQYATNLDKCRRNRLNVSLRQGYDLCQCDIARAYEVIRLNRESHGYPLRMSLPQLIDTITNCVSADCFALTNGSDDAAAAIVYHTTLNVVQVIYWGDKPDNGCRYAMNLLAYRLFEHYAQTDIRIVDIGPSAENGILSPGLAEFKENIGCFATQKFSFTN